MQNWLKDNAVSIIIAIVTLVSTYAVYGYRLAAVELKAQQNSEAITLLQSSNNQINVSLAEIKTSLIYIQAKLDRIAQ